VRSTHVSVLKNQTNLISTLRYVRGWCERSLSLTLVWFDALDSRINIFLHKCSSKVDLIFTSAICKVALCCCTYANMVVFSTDFVHFLIFNLLIIGSVYNSVSNFRCLEAQARLRHITRDRGHDTTVQGRGSENCTSRRGSASRHHNTDCSCITQNRYKRFWAWNV